MPGQPPLTTSSGGRLAWKIAILRGVPIYIHATLVLLLVWSVWVASRSGGPILHQVLFLAGLFASVLLHELGHALAAGGCGIHTTEIVLYPFGGIARMRSLGRPHQEFWISLAGPAVNFLLGLLLFLALQTQGAWVPFDRLTDHPTHAAQWLMLANATLAAFNLVPAFPLDGGRVVRALLALRLGMVRATNIAAYIGQGFAVLLGLVGLYAGEFMLVAIALFIFIGAGQEARMQRRISLLRGHQVAEVMQADPELLQGDTPLSTAADRLRAGSQEHFPVVTGGNVVGLLTREDLVAGLARVGLRAPVLEATSSIYLSLAPEEDLATATGRMQATGTSVALIFRGSRLVGMLTEERVRSYLQLQAASRHRDPTQPPG